MKRVKFRVFPGSRIRLKDPAMKPKPPPQRVAPVTQRGGNGYGDGDSTSDVSPSALEKPPTDSPTQDATHHQPAPEVRPELATSCVVIAFHSVGPLITVQATSMVHAPTKNRKTRCNGQESDGNEVECPIRQRDTVDTNLGEDDETVFTRPDDRKFAKNKEPGGEGGENQRSD